MVFQLAKVAGESDVLRARDVLIPEEQNLVLEQESADLRDESRVARGDAQVHVRKLGADCARKLVDLDGRPNDRRRFDDRVVHGLSTSKMEEPVVLRDSR